MNKSERKKLIELLIKQFQELSNAQTKLWFDNYLKGAIEYRGIKTPQVTSLVKQWRSTNQLALYTSSEQLTLCLDLISSSYAEDKFAGIIYLQKFLITKINYQILLNQFNSLFQKDYFFDWATTDSFCNRVLDPIIIQNGINAGVILANWRDSNNLWQRRAAIVSFRHASLNPDYHSLIELIIEKLVQENERFIQTGIGWVLADMSKKYPSQVEALFYKYLKHLNKEVIDRHSKYLISHQDLKQKKRELISFSK